jgi:hypothetical protein
MPRLTALPAVSPGDSGENEREGYTGKSFNAVGIFMLKLNFQNSIAPKSIHAPSASTFQIQLTVHYFLAWKI